MVTTWLPMALLIVLAFIFFLFMGRSLRSRHLGVKLAGALVFGLIGLAFSALVAVALVGVWRLDAPRDRPLGDLKVEATPQLLARGEQLAWLCADCHSADGQLPLNGGRRNLLTGEVPLGELYGPNLTPAGDVQQWSDGQIVRAIREGLDHRGIPLLAMPSRAYRSLADEDAQALVAYIRSQPALRNDQPPRNPTILVRLLMGIGRIQTAEQPPLDMPVVAPPRGVTPDYGRYLVAIAACADCHGPALDGLPASPLSPRGSNLGALVPSYTSDQFVHFFRTGQTPLGETAAVPMFGLHAGRAMSDDDLRAVYAYLSGLN